MRRSLSVLACLVALSAAGFAFPVESLPGPTVNAHSFELLSNSRYSTHSGFQDSLPTEVLANVLWAMNLAPRCGTFRDLYVATPENIYIYRPGSNTLELHRAGDYRYSSGAAFEIGVATDRHEDAGYSIQVGLLAGAAFWDFGSGNVASCPMKWAADHANSNWNPDDEILMVNVFGRAAVDGLDSTLVAVSSDTSLPAPHTTGPDTIEIVLMALSEDTLFSSAGISLETASQLLWSGYGPTAHRAYNGRRGLTVPSAVAAYHLAGHIYLVTGDGVDRYHCRLPGGSHNTADHRLERVVTGDRRPELRLASDSIPSTAPAYVVVCVADTAPYRTMQEAGFAGFQMLVQARAMGLSGHLCAPLSPQEREDIGFALDLPLNDFAAVVFAVGEPTTGVEEKDEPRAVEIVRAQPVIRPGTSLRIEYLLRRSGNVRVEVFDLLGRPVHLIFEERRSAGYHSVEWDGYIGNGRRVERGSYVIGIFGPGAVAQHKITVF